MHTVKNQGFAARSWRAALAACVMLSTGGCAIVGQQALEPADWVGQQVERYEATGTGGWARLRNKPVTIGPYTAEVRAKSPWSTLPTSTSTDTQVSFGADGGRELSSGTTTRHNDAELEFHLSGPGGAVADVRCRQLLHIETTGIGVTRSDGTDAFSMSELAAYKSSLSCRASGNTASWPQWQLELSSGEPSPLRGHLTIDGVSFEVLGSQASNIGQAPMTVSYEIRRGEHTVALVDRSGDGRLSVSLPVGEKQQLAFVGAAVALLISNDPLES